MNQSTADPRVLTIVLNYRTPALTVLAVEAALRAMEGLEGAITVVDNDSGDGSFETLTRAVQERGWNRVRVLQSGHNAYVQLHHDAYNRPTSTAKIEFIGRASTIFFAPSFPSARAFVACSSL